MIENQLSEGFRSTDQVLSHEELLSILDKKHQRGEFSRDLFDQLIGQLDASGEELTIRSFAEVWIRAEENLIRTQEANEDEINALELERDDYIQKKVEIEDNEIRNAYNIMQNSELNVFVQNIENIRRNNGDQMAANFVLQCESQQVETGISDNPSNFNVNKNFRFNVKTGQSPLEVFMLDVTSHSGEEIEGVINIPLYDLKDQAKKTVSMNFLHPTSNTELPTKINMDVTWVFSNVKLYADKIANLEYEIEDKTLENNEVKNYLHDLYSPFPLLRKNVPIVEDQRPNLETFHNPNIGVAREKQFARLPHSSSPVSILLIMAYIYLIVSLITSYDRCVFMDLLVAFLLFSALQLNIPLFSKGFGIKAISGIVVALLIDIVWLFYYTVPWWKTGHIDGFSHLYLRRAMIIFSYILMLIRIIMIISIVLSLKELPDSKNEFEIKKENKASKYDPFGSNQQAFPGF